VSIRRVRRDSHPLLRAAGLAALLGATGLALDLAGRSVGTLLRMAGLL
jgi:hypothetical protein